MPTTIEILRGIDTDNYDGIIPISHFKMLHDDYAMRFNILGLEAKMPFVKAQRDASESVGISCPWGYKFLYWDSPDVYEASAYPGIELDRMKQAATTLGRPVAIDCEYAVPSNWSKAQVVNRIHEAKDALVSLGLYWGIYTGEWWWPSQTNGCKDFAGDKLWHAAYPFGDGLPPASYLPSDFTVNYGGWTECEVFQYANNCYGDDAGPWALDMNAYKGIIEIPNPIPEPKWLYGDKSGGLEKRGNQKVEWNNFIETDIRGDEAGLTPGLWLHNEGGIWVQLAP